jgi:hypothetical protein
VARSGLDGEAERIARLDEPGEVACERLLPRSPRRRLRRLAVAQPPPALGLLRLGSDEQPHAACPRELLAELREAADVEVGGRDRERVRLAELPVEAVEVASQRLADRLPVAVQEHLGAEAAARAHAAAVTDDRRAKCASTRSSRGP